jgi:hypothetical protein
MKKQETLLDGLQISEERGREIHDYVVDLLYASQDLCVLLQGLITNLELSTKELVFASYLVGKLNVAYSEEEMARHQLMINLKSIADSIVDNAKK